MLKAGSLSKRSDSSRMLPSLKLNSQRPSIQKSIDSLLYSQDSLLKKYISEDQGNAYKKIINSKQVHSNLQFKSKGQLKQARKMRIFIKDVKQMENSTNREQQLSQSSRNELIKQHAQLTFKIEQIHWEFDIYYKKIQDLSQTILHIRRKCQARAHLNESLKKQLELYRRQAQKIDHERHQINLLNLGLAQENQANILLNEKMKKKQQSCKKLNSFLFYPKESDIKDLSNQQQVMRLKQQIQANYFASDVLNLSLQNLLNQYQRFKDNINSISSIVGASNPKMLSPIIQDIGNGLIMLNSAIRQKQPLHQKANLYNRQLKNKIILLQQGQHSIRHDQVYLNTSFQIEKEKALTVASRWAKVQQWCLKISQKLGLGCSGVKQIQQRMMLVLKKTIELKDQLQYNQF